MDWEQLVRQHFARQPLTFQNLLESVEYFVEDAPGTAAGVSAKLNPLREKVIQFLGTVKDKYEIQSVAMGKSSGMLIVRFKNPEKRMEHAPGIFAELGAIPDFTVEHRQTGSSSMPITLIKTMIDGKKWETRLVYKYEIKTRQGLAFEHILAYVITGEITPKLKNRMDFRKTTPDDEIEQALKGPPWDLHMERAFIALAEMEKHFGGKITQAAVVGGGGSKADLEIITPTGDKVGISLKLALKKENKFIFNKDLGDGTSANSIIPNPEPWWVTARKLVFANLKQAGFIEDDESYNPSDTDYMPPDWLLAAKTRAKSDPARKIYDVAVSRVFAEIRQQLLRSLRSMDFKDLVSFVSEAHHGIPDDPENVIPLYKLVSGSKGAHLEEVPQSQPNMVEIETQGIGMDDMVTAKGDRITIDIPGMPEAVIQGVKYRSSLVATKKSDLRIKTR